MNTKITALKKKIELKKAQLKSKEELALRSKEAVKEIKHEIELLNNELAGEEMQEMLELMGEKNLNIDDVKAAIASGAIVGSGAAEKTNENTENTKTDIDEDNIENISAQIEEINKEDNTNA